MTTKPDSRPISPYMLGPYYKFQVTSFLSIISRITGLFLAAVTAPVAILWLLALMLGADSFNAMQSFLGGWIGRGIALFSLFSLVYHLYNGIRHLVWDTGRGFDIETVRISGYFMLGATLGTVTVIAWVAS